MSDRSHAPGGIASAAVDACLTTKLAAGAQPRDHGEVVGISVALITVMRGAMGFVDHRQIKVFL